MNKTKKDVMRFMGELKEYADKIDLKETIKSGTGRSFKARLRDKLVFWRTAWSAGIQFAAIPKEAMMWISLMPIAIANVNEAFKWLGFPLYIPVSWGATVGLGFIIGVMIFGVFAFTRFGTRRRDYEIASQQNPAYGFLYFKIEESEERIMERLDRIEGGYIEEIKSLEEDKKSLEKALGIPK